MAHGALRTLFRAAALWVQSCSKSGEETQPPLSVAHWKFWWLAEAKSCATWLQQLELNPSSQSSRRLASSSYFSISGDAEVDGLCFTSDNYPSNYGNNDYATISVLFTGTLNVSYFYTESSYDSLTISSTDYNGKVKAGTTWSVTSGDTIIWDSDYSVTQPGFEICAIHTPSPSPTMTPVPTITYAPTPIPTVAATSSTVSPTIYNCSSAWCTSPDGYGGYDCWAGTSDEGCTCSQGEARETHVYSGSYYQYECCLSDSYGWNDGKYCGVYGANTKGQSSPSSSSSYAAAGVPLPAAACAAAPRARRRKSQRR